MNIEMVLALIVGLVLGYYVVGHYMVAGKLA